MVRPILFLIWILFGLGASNCFAAPAETEFWLKSKISVSPDGLWKLERSPNHEGTKTVYLTGPGVRGMEVQRTERWVAVLWAPKGNAVIINNHVGSNRERCVIVVVGKDVTIHDVTDEVCRAIWGGREMPPIAHVYIDGHKWLGSDEVAIKVEEYAWEGVRDADYQVRYRLGKGVVEVREEKEKTNG